MTENNSDLKLSQPNDKLTYYGIRGLSDREIIRNLISSLTPEQDKQDNLIESIIKAFDRNLPIKPEMLSSIPGMNPKIVKLLLSSLELGRRWPARKSRQIRTPDDAYAEIRHYAQRPQEHLIVVALNGAHEIMFTQVVSIGTVNMTYAHPREIFADAVMARATGIILAHNHPSGVLMVSAEDASITKRVISCGQLLGITVLDHIIITEHGYLSMKAKGIIP